MRTSTRRRRLVLAGTTVTTLLAATAPSLSQAPDAAVQRARRSLRSGKERRLGFSLNQTAGTASDGFACFSITYPCAEPQAVILLADGQEAMRFKARRPDGSLQEEPPRAVCVPTDDLPDGDHSFGLQVTCGHARPSAVLRVPTRRRTVALRKIVPDRPWYGFGDTVELEVDGTSPGLTLSVDFSAMDSEYRAGDEVVTDAGDGTYRVSYPLSAANTRTSGDHEVVVSLRRPATRSEPEKAHEAPASLRYLPHGPALLHFAGGGFHATAPPWDPRGDPSLSLEAFGPVGTPTAPVPDSARPPAPQPFFGEPGPAPEPYGQRIEITASSAGTTPLPTLALEVRESGRDGFTRIGIDLSGATCDPAVGRCIYQGTLWARPKTPMTGTVGLDLRLASGGRSSPTFHHDLDITGGDLPPTAPNYRVKGRLVYQYLESLPDLNTPLGSSPQDYPETFVLKEAPAARANLQIWDSCGYGWSIYTDDEGGFLLDFWSPCGDEPAMMRLFSYRQPLPRAVSVFKWTNANKTVDEPTDLTANPGDYGIHGYTFSFTPGDGPFEEGGQDLGTLTVTSGYTLAKALYIMDNVARAVSYFSNWKSSWSFHQMNVEYDPTRVMSDDYNVYLPSIHASLIHIEGNCTGGCGTVTWGWRAFAHAHEVGHYFHRRFLRDDGGSYGRFGEPMANFNAAAILGLSGINRWSQTANTWVLESMDVNGFADGNAFFKQAKMDFFPDTQAAAMDCAKASQGGVSCCQVQGGVDARGDCRLAHSQGWDWRIYYDLHDPISAQAPEPTYTVYVDGDPNAPVLVQAFDGVDGKGGNANPADDAVMDVLVNYLGDDPPNPKYTDRGMSGIDLVDVLDGMVCRGHMTAQTGTKLLNQMMAYGYDFSPVNATCP